MPETNLGKTPPKNPCKTLKWDTTSYSPCSHLRREEDCITQESYKHWSLLTSGQLMPEKLGPQMAPHEFHLDVPTRKVLACTSLICRPAVVQVKRAQKRATFLYWSAPMLEGMYMGTPRQSPQAKTGPSGGVVRRTWQILGQARLSSFGNKPKPGCQMTAARRKLVLYVPRMSDDVCRDMHAKLVVGPLGLLAGLVPPCY